MFRKVIVCLTFITVLTVSIFCLSEIMPTNVTATSESNHESNHENANTDANDMITIESVPAVSYNIASAYNEQLQTLKKEHTFDAEASAISVSSVKVTWNDEPNHIHKVECHRINNETSEYDRNICVKKVGNGKCYITGLREDTGYVITVSDLTEEASKTLFVRTENVKILEEYDYISGWTNCFAGEPVSGLTLDPSKSAIKGAITDPVTNTGIMRNEYGDYCVAMGLHYGRCGDRFLIELENGTQFTVKICDSKGKASDGEGKYHYFGKKRTGKCIVEFIYNEDYLPENVAWRGSYGFFDWDGLKLTENIKSIYRIEYGNTITY